MNTGRLCAIVFTAFQLAWAFIWAVKHLRIRWLRRYAGHRTKADTNSLYKLVSPLLYLFQNLLCIASFWFNSSILFKIHDSDAVRFIGILLVSFGTVLYFKSLAHLGRNYSPCFDQHVPFKVISSGPYRFTRHPMYLAKLVVVVGNFVLSGSLWFIAMFGYLLAETIRTIVKEERYLCQSLEEYSDYKKATARIPPFLC